jgi:L-2-hydroxyglutarate oxidase LhgO
VLEALKGDISKAKSNFQSHNNHDKRLVFFINQQISIMVPKKMVYGKPEKRKEAGLPHHPMVHGELPSSPQQTQSQNDLRRRRQLQQMTKGMIQGPKRPRNLPWLPKSVPA